jgi:ribosome-binding factor A
MESTRQLKFARAIQRELSLLLQQEVEPELGAIITLNLVRATPDLALARAYLTVLPEEKTAQVLSLLAQENWQIRHLLAQRIRNIVRQVPEIQFFEDETRKQAERVDSLLSGITYTTPEGDEPLDGYEE